MKFAYAGLTRLLTPAERRTAVGILALMFVGMLLETLGIGLVLPALAVLTRGDIAERVPAAATVLAWMGNPTRAALVTRVMLGLVFIYVFKNVFLAFVIWQQNRFAFGVQASLSQRVFGIYLRQPYTFHLQRNSAQLIHNVTREVELFTYNGILSAILLITEGLVILGIATLWFIVEPVGASFVVAVLGGATLVFHRLTRGRLLKWGEQRLRHEGLRVQHLQQGLGGVKDVKLLGREDEFLAQYSMHSSGSAMVGKYQATVQQLPRLWIEILAIVALATLVLTMQARGRDIGSMIPALGLFGAAAFRLMPSANRVIGAIQAIRYALPGMQILVHEVALESSVQHQAAQRAKRTHELTSDIRLEHVTYAYPEAARSALHGVSVIVRRGESVGFVGPSGSGKTTLVDVILGLLSPSRGSVLVDGAPIQHDVRAWQDRIGYVPQTIFLTDDTLERNIAFGIKQEEIDDVAVKRAIRAAQLEEFVASLPDGLKSMVGERGVRLSGGQRQRIGIARALYHDPDVLVLDEATSALDTPTERSVMDAVTALKGQKTIIVVAHRLSTVEHCDRLYRLEAGRVAAEGTPDAVLRVPHVV